MIRALRRLRDRSRLLKARQAYHADYARYQDAVDRQDRRDMGRFLPPLQASHRAFIAAEIAAKPIPYPMPRHGAASQGN